MIDDSPLSITVHRPDRGTVVLSLAGDLDFDTADELVTAAEHALTPEVRAICLDLAGLYICDSSGLSALIHVSQDARRLNATFGITGVTAQLRRILQVTGLDTVLGVASTREDRAAAQA